MTYELFLKSRHWRLKLESFVLLIYSVYHGNGLVPVLEMLVGNNHTSIDFFNMGRTGLGLYCTLSSLSIVLWWWLSFRILCHLHWFFEDQAWQHKNKVIAFISCVSWVLGLLSWMFSILINNRINLRYIIYSILPFWNKGLAMGLVFVIFREFDTHMPRERRVLFWIKLLSVFLAPYTVLAMIVGFYAIVGVNIVLLIVIVPIVISIVAMWCVLMYNTGGFCRQSTCCMCTQKLWIIAGMTWFWLLATLLGNDNICFTDAIILEFIFGFRGSTLLMIFFSVLILIELKYGGSVVSGLASYEQIGPHTGSNHIVTSNNSDQQQGIDLQTNTTATTTTAAAAATTAATTSGRQQENSRDSDEESDESHDNSELQGVRVELPTT